MLGFLNRLARALQSWIQGIPAPGAYIYRATASKMLRKFHRAIADELSKLLSDGPLLDVGCGTASLIKESARIKRLSRGFIGLDISVAMARIARDEVRKEGLDSWVDVVVGDAHALPLRSSSMEVAVATGMLHHLPNPSSFFAECSRVVKKVCRVYEFAHDAPWREFSEASRQLSIPPLLLKLVSALHGIPRRDYSEGSIAQALRDSGTEHRVVFRGPVTLLEVR